jgi:gliding motility-associated-like protein
VKLEAIDKLFIPTGFTPNGDGLNDKWEIVTFEDYEDAIAEVYNRYGQIVYRGHAKNYKPWDGTFKNKPCLPGVYVYVVNLHNGKPVLKGTRRSSSRSRPTPTARRPATASASSANC